MREDLEAVLTRDGNERDAGALGRIQRELRRRGHSNDHWRTGASSLLNHLHRYAARQQHDTVAHVDLAPPELADELVERVVAADILGDRDETLFAVPEPRTVHGPRQQIEFLRRSQRRHGLHDLGSRKARTAFDRRDRGCSFIQTLDPAEAAAGRTDDAPPPRHQCVPAILREPHAQLDALLVLDDLELLDLAGMRDDPLAQAEADGKVLEIRRGAHHDGLRGAVIDERDRHLYRQLALLRDAAGLGDLDRCRANRGLRHYLIPRPPPLCDGSPARRLHSLPGTVSDRSKGRPAPPSPCIRGSSSPSRSNPW